LIRTAILVDGGFYRKRAKFLWHEKTAEERAKELSAYKLICTIRTLESAVSCIESFIMTVSPLGGEASIIH